MYVDSAFGLAQAGAGAVGAIARRCPGASVPLGRLGKDLLKDERGGLRAPKAPGGNSGQPALRTIHPDSTYASDAEAKASLEHWRTRPTQEIVDSLTPGGREPLMTNSDGRMMNRNTRTKVLQERGYDINSLPREVLPPDPLLEH